MPSSGARPLNVNSEVYQPRATFRDMFIIVIPASEAFPSSANFLDVSIVIIPTFEACILSILYQPSKHARPVPSLEVYSSLRQGLQRVRHT